MFAVKMKKTTILFQILGSYGSMFTIVVLDTIYRKQEVINESNILSILGISLAFSFLPIVFLIAYLIKKAN